MNAEQKQRAKDLLQQYASYTNPRLLMLVDMAALLQELIDADEKSKYSVLAAPSVPDGKVGFSMYFDREQWGAIIDGLGFEIERSEQRKAANCESTSNVRADMCKEIILAINRVSDTAFTAQLLPEPPADLVRDAERWAPIADFNGIYEVSTIGRIRSVTRIDSDNNRRLAKYLTPTAIRKGYLKVCLWNGGERIERYVHRLVASAFIENPDHLPQVNHKDGDPANNEVSNLEWVTNAQNQTHARRILAKGVRAVYGISLADGYRIDFASLELAVEAGFVRANIQKCIAGTRKKHKGYAWYDAAIEREKKGQS